MIVNFKAQQSQEKKERAMSASIYPIKYIDYIECSGDDYVEQFDATFSPIVPPFSNTGGIEESYVKTYACDLSPSTNFSCIVDFLSFSFSMNPLSIYDKIEPSDVFVGRFLSLLAGYVPHLKWSFQDKGLFGYKKSCTLARNGQNVGLVGFEGNLNSCYVSLSGQGCVGVDMAKLKKYIEVLPKCKITRIDLAHDDLEGLTGVLEYLDLYKAGAFASGRGSAPSARFIDDLGTGKGSTLYVGNKKNGKEACIYEKGRQLGDKHSKWVRVEGRLTAVDRVVPFDAMINPSHFLAGLYEPFGVLSSIHARLVIIQKHSEIALAVILEHASIAYGRLFNYLKKIGWSDAKINQKISRPGTPKRLLIPDTMLKNTVPF